MEHPTQGEVFSIRTFCEAYGISRALFYKLKKNGTAPRTFKLGRRILISREAARAWMLKMEGTRA